MKAHLTRRYKFSASHRLHNGELSGEENQRLYGKCNNPYGHGHNYALEVTLAGDVNAETGMVCDLAALDALVQREVLERYEHSNLNMLEEFQDSVPTTENLCKKIFERLRKRVPLVKLEKIRMEETMLNSFEYAGDAELRG